MPVVLSVERDGGPLSDLGVKINLAYMMGLCSEEAHRELDTIKGLRNDFAHKLEMNDFLNQSVRARCDNLKLWEDIKIKFRAANGLKVGQTIELIMGRGLREGEQEAFLMGPLKRAEAEVEQKIYARERYINACKFFIAGCTIALQYKAKDRAVPAF